MACLPERLRDHVYYDEEAADEHGDHEC
jgi:hypothetical protein